MTIDYIRLPTSILHLKGLSFAQRIILALVASFDTKGLGMSNSAIGEIITISADQVSHSIKDLEGKGYVRIESGQSKWRRIYLVENPEVTSVLLRGKPRSKPILLRGKPRSKPILLRGLTGSTSGKTPNRTKTTKEHIYDQIEEPVSDHRHTGSNGELFDRFWSEYPRKVGKKKCRDIWKRLKVSPELADQIVAKVKSYKSTKGWQKDDGQFIPPPSTWLNAGRWEDEIPEASTLKPGDIGYEQSEAEVEEMMKASGLL